MSRTHAIVAGVALGAAAIIGSIAEAQARNSRDITDLQAGGGDATASVTLDKLSTKLLGVDRPWDPRICVGCTAAHVAPGRSSRRMRER